MNYTDYEAFRIFFSSNENSGYFQRLTAYFHRQMRKKYNDSSLESIKRACGNFYKPRGESLKKTGIENRTVKWFTVMVFLFDVFRNINSIYSKVSCLKESGSYSREQSVYGPCKQLDEHETHERIRQNERLP